MNPYKIVKKALELDSKLSAYCNDMKKYIHKHVIFDNVEDDDEVDILKSDNVVSIIPGDGMCYSYNKLNGKGQPCDVPIELILNEIAAKGKVYYSDILNINL